MLRALPLLALACAAAGEALPAQVLDAEGLAAQAPAEAPTPPDPFAEWLAAPIPVADGFDAPVIGWAPCGDGCWSRRAPKSGTPATPGTVRAVANGIVREVGADTLVTEHLWYDDEVKRTATFRWQGVTSPLAAGATLTRDQPIGTATTVQLSAEAGDIGPIEPFLAGRPRLPVPQAEPILALVSHTLDQLRLYVGGKEIGTFEVAFGQAEGDKEWRGDNRTPTGIYHVVARSKGPFDGEYGAYYGGYWIKLGYPNAWDAARGVDAGLFDTEVQRAITRAFWDRRTPLQGTKLGGGIGLHGWAHEWSDEGGRGLSWGCVVLHLRDVATIYDALDEGAMVALF
ncbi:MAG: L,D-transpeptidase [Myxococcota bacterium]